MSKDKFRKVEHTRMAEAVVEQVEEMILHGTLRDGERLPSERDLADRLDVSRQTLREALKALEEKGLVESRQGGGTFIANIVGSAISEPLVELFSRHEEAYLDYMAFRLLLLVLLLLCLALAYASAFSPVAPARSVAAAARSDVVMGAKKGKPQPHQTA